MRHIYILLFGIIIVISAFGILFFSLSNTAPEKEEEDKTPHIEAREEEQNPPKKEEEVPADPDDLYATALAKQDAALCSGTGNRAQECKDAIFLSKALEETNKQYCGSIQNEEKRQYCFDLLLYELAKSQEDFSGCSLIQNLSLKGKCTALEDEYLLLHASSAEECASLDDPEKKQVCEDFFYAKTLQEEKKTSAESCEGYSNAAKREECLLDIVIETAKRTQSTEPCDNLEEQQQKTRCLSSLKSHLETEQMKKDIAVGNTSGCMDIVNSEKRQQCYDLAYTVRAKKEHDVSLCDKVQNDFQQSKCTESARAAANTYYLQRAKEEHDPIYCSSLMDTDLQKTCLMYANSVE